MIVIKKDEALESVKNKAWYPPGCENKDRHIDFLFNGCSEIDLVQCKDCQRIDENGWCEFIGGYVHDGFCAWGEGRE